MRYGLVAAAAGLAVLGVAVLDPAVGPAALAETPAQPLASPMAVGPAQQNQAPANAASTVPVRAATPMPARGTIAALDGPTRELVQKINTSFNALVFASGDFVQVAPDGGRTQGQFYLQKPGKVRFDYAPPSPLEFISDGGSIAVRDKKLATQDITPLSQTPLRFLLADKVDLLRDAPVIAVQKDELFVSVVLEERHPVAGTHRLMLMFGAQDFQLKQWTVTDSQGYDTTVAIYNVDTTRRPSADLFKINYERVLQ
ncbi:outer-membrane lipoprotein carrier protein LolA [Blastochloris viridis]|uniref:Lipoprotein chaperone n=1 Tax=Blastochloris viridis TaxID=1079 RepID=A0A0H5BCE6_BLAVI|nr:outer-membrane lipoprotein carrier protein LolA [Blastochloris viridis]ALK07932.1 Outer-membrane lipoprotein carrier protein [Blastochloris viridis]BAR98814.1 outer membrane lipoprotein carrier protein LolA [Blastochloris viridis]CUU43854.1 lipoprotein chaperone [Blastochloris viridis]